MKLQGTASDGTLFHMWLEQLGLVASSGLFWSFCHIFRALCHPATLKRNMTGDFVGMTWTLCNGTVSERPTPIIQFAFAQTFFRGKSSIKVKFRFGPKADSYFYILHCAELCTLTSTVNTRKHEYAVLVQPWETWTRWSISYISLCICTACQSTKRPHIIAIFIYPITIVTFVVVIHVYISG